MRSASGSVKASLSRHVVVQEAARLVSPQPGVGWLVETEQLLVRALLDDPAAVEHDQLVHARDRAQPMRDQRARSGRP